jgi:hypothetical protein
MQHPYSFPAVYAVNGRCESANISGSVQLSIQRTDSPDLTPIAQKCQRSGSGSFNIVLISINPARPDVRARASQLKNGNISIDFSFSSNLVRLFIGRDFLYQNHLILTPLTCRESPK